MIQEEEKNRIPFTVSKWAVLAGLALTLVSCLIAFKYGQGIYYERFFLPQYYQTFPIEDYPGIECYVIATEMRYAVLTQNCKTVFVKDDVILIGNYSIPRQSPGERCNRCYKSDYLSALGFLLFGRPEEGIEPIAKKGLLLIEDDVIICSASLSMLKRCHSQQVNCILGRGATVNYFAGAKTEQPTPSNDRFTEESELHNEAKHKAEEHTDQYLNALQKHAIKLPVCIHVGGISTLSHKNGFIQGCSVDESLLGRKVLL